MWWLGLEELGDGAFIEMTNSDSLEDPTRTDGEG